MFAGVRNDAVHTADMAVNPNKTARQNPAIQKRAQLAFHKPGYHPSAVLLPGQKGLDVSGYNTVKNAFLRMARAIFKSPSQTLRPQPEYKGSPSAYRLPLSNTVDAQKAIFAAQLPRHEAALELTGREAD